jgi:hypothetical protein
VKKAKSKEGSAHQPILSVYLSAEKWPTLELVVDTDTGRQYSKTSMYDIAQPQFEVVIQNALRDNLRAAILLCQARNK